ncbi:MAG TPA: hypothetical protein VF026_14250 [Ktedonobacteraceae bacterium]
MSTLLFRISGLLLLLGGLLMAVTNFHLPISPVAAALINLLGGVLLLLGLPALYARQATQVRWIGLVGLIIIWLDTLIFPVLQGGIGGLVPALTPPDFLYIIGPLTIIGTLLFGIMTMRAHVFPGWLGFCLFVGYILGVIGIIFLGKSVPFIGLLGILLYWLSFSAFGVVLFSRPGPLPERSAHSAAVREALPTEK